MFGLSEGCRGLAKNAHGKGKTLASGMAWVRGHPPGGIGWLWGQRDMSQGALGLLSVSTT